MEKESVNEVKEKNLFFSMIRAIVLAVIIFSFIFTIQRNGIIEKKNLVNAFNSNEQIVCSSKIVSLNNGFKFDEKRENYVTNGVDIFLISKCILK